jgi:putative membrane protein
MPMVYLLVALLGAAIALFAVQNNSAVVVRFLGWQIEEPLSLVILLSVLVGIVLTALLGVVRSWKLRSRIRQLENMLARSQAPGSQGDSQDRL